MAEFPALPLWTDAYLGDTTHLETLEHGAYLLLLMVAWRSRDCRLPDDDRILARYAKLGPRQWTKIRPIIEAFFVVENGFWTQRRLTDEADAVRQRKDKAAQAGRASALKRKGRHSTDVRSKSNSTATKTLPEGNITSTNNQVEKTGTKKTIPKDWVAKPFGDGTASRRIVDGWSLDERQRQLEAFKAHHIANGSKFVDWQQAWSTWTLNSVKFDKPRANGRPSESESYVDVLEREERNRSILEERRVAAAGGSR